MPSRLVFTVKSPAAVLHVGCMLTKPLHAVYNKSQPEQSHTLQKQHTFDSLCTPGPYPNVRSGPFTPCLRSPLNDRLCGVQEDVGGTEQRLRDSRRKPKHKASKLKRHQVLLIQGA